MAEVVLFHHVQGLTDGVRAFADALRAGGHTVHTPDLFDGARPASVDDGVAQEMDRTRQPPVGGEGVHGAVGRLELRGRGQVRRVGGDAVLGKRAEARRDRAAAADPAGAADGVDVDAERAGQAIAALVAHVGVVAGLAPTATLAHSLSLKSTNANLGLYSIAFGGR